MSTFRRCAALLLAFALLFSLSACNSVSETKEEQSPAGQQESVSEASASQEQDEASNAQEQQTESSAEEIPSTETGGSDTLVVYFSRTGEQYSVGVIDKGNTAIVADMVIEETGADSFEILPEEDYPYTYDELTEVAKREQSENARPAYTGEVPDLTQYSTIFIGAPVWWGDWPMICYTFFENNADALAGKTLIPFSTHGGSGLSGFDRKLAEACPNSTVDEGLAIAGTDAQNNQDSVRDTVNDWLSGLGY